MFVEQKLTTTISHISPYFSNAFITFTSKFLDFQTKIFHECKYNTKMTKKLRKKQ